MPASGRSKAWRQATRAATFFPAGAPKGRALVLKDRQVLKGLAASLLRTARGPSRRPSRRATAAVGNRGRNLVAPAAESRRHQDWPGLEVP